MSLEMRSCGIVSQMDDANKARSRTLVSSDRVNMMDAGVAEIG